MHMQRLYLFMYLMYLNIVWCLPNCAHKVSMNTTLKQGHLGKANEL